MPAVAIPIKFSENAPMKSIEYEPLIAASESAIEGVKVTNR